MAPEVRLRNPKGLDSRYKKFRMKQEKNTNQFGVLESPFIEGLRQTGPDFLRKLGARLLLGLVRTLLWFLYNALNTPFGYFLYIFSIAYSQFGEQREVLFTSQAYAANYVFILISLSVMLPLLMLVPPVWRFLCSEVGEKEVFKWVGWRGVRPLLAAVFGPILLSFIETWTKDPSIDLNHYLEIQKHSQGIREENLIILEREVDKIIVEQAPLLEEDEGSRDPVLVEEIIKKKKDLMTNHLDRDNRLTNDTLSMQLLAIESEGDRGWVTEFSDRVKEVVRGRERSTSLMVLDRSLQGSKGLDHFNQAPALDDLASQLKGLEIQGDQGGKEK